MWVRLCRGRGSCYYIFGPRYYPVAFELSIGIYLGLRVGINVDELIDFLRGIVGFDSLDDSSSDEPVYRELPLPAHENKDWESKFEALDEKMDRRLKK
ncbi:MAG: hypothetical protein IPL26_28590 [Leptospiraceae bacterium]|nr:hypothetical protein [Leptospiraceae bacterium]